MFRRRAMKITTWPYCSDHKEEATCKCGQNVICHECGFGHANYPCSCQHDDLLELSLTKHAEIWEALARR